MIQASKHLATPDQRQIAWALGISAILFILRAIYLMAYTPYGLGPDEAQYWHWLAHNDLAFATKPALTTWLIGLSTTVYGHTLWGVKAFAIIGQALVPVLGMALAQKVAPGNPRAGWLTFALLATSPLVAAGGLIMSPDAVLLPIWLGALLVLANQIDKPSLNLKNALLLGVLVGLAGLAKYSAALFIPLLAVFVVLYKRAWLVQPGIYLVAAIALAMQAPTLIWNVQHDYAGLNHLLWQAGGNADIRHGGLKTLLEFLGGQAGVLGPLAFVGVLAAWGLHVKNKSKGNAASLVWWFTFPIFAVFVLLTTQAKVQPNWPLLGTVPAFVLAAVWLAGWKNKVLQTLMVAGLVLSTVLSGALYNTNLLREMGVPLKIKIDPTKDLMGWHEFGNLTGSLLAGLQPGTLIIANRYQTVAQLAYHVPQARAFVESRGKVGSPVLYLNTGGRRQNQYDFWAWPNLKGKMAVYVTENGQLPAEMQQRFAVCEPWQRVQVTAGQSEALRRAALWLCWNPVPAAPLAP